MSRECEKDLVQAGLAESEGGYLDSCTRELGKSGGDPFSVVDSGPVGVHARRKCRRVAPRGDALLSPAITRKLISEFVSRPPDAISSAGLETLTNREREVVASVAHGLSNDEIARTMVVSPTTAKTHVSRAMTKLQARDRAPAVVFAYQSGLVSARDPQH